MEITLKNVSKSFNEICILNDVNVTFKSGNIYALVGINGSGKSVLLKMICGFYAPSSGEILQDGFNYIENGKYPVDTRCLIEKPQFLPELTGYENLKLLADIQGKIGKQEIEQALKIVNLYQDKDKKYFKYSLGMKQKLGIAQVLMENPEVIILDEPFNGIEKNTATIIRKELKRLAALGKLIIIATQIDIDIKAFADIVYEVDDGKVYSVVMEESNR